ncbi:hypothetical protein RSOLAG1IB_07709 [Rhizoctonia solani AG-1 IB]|uniref:Uncharacterized protein n=1 Tax=Thanatephorus cucumeris (strain AG1-IB / isolate 7/3/14) TaxID=1108050 RepID=A0A0B7FJ79_THACB|nr:hypothetical protein RSOLAG1IB_07709 [Rhizoctonia solani AG-1 IB]
MSAPNDTSYADATLEQWHDAGASLLAAFNRYADMCSNLGPGLATQGASVEDFVSKIDSNLQTVHTVISSQLPKNTTHLVQTRNKLVSPVFRLPKEMLSEIFLNFAFGPSLDVSDPPSMNQSVRLAYARLYTLCDVCSAWRDIVMNCGMLWSVIPLIPMPLGSKPKPYELSLQRAGGSLLHLAADVDADYNQDMREAMLKLLSEYGPRLRAVNLGVNENGSKTAVSAIEALLYHNTTDGFQLSELSITRYYKHPSLSHFLFASSARDLHYTVPRDRDYIFPRDSLQQASLIRLLRSLTVFRVSKVLLHWDNVAFSSQLVDIQIENVTLGYDDAIISFLASLASASQLRNLAISDVITFERTDKTAEMNAHPLIVLPKLQSLVIQDLFFNTLKTITSTISSGQAHLTLFLNKRCTQVNRKERRIQRLDHSWDSDVDVGSDLSELWAVLGTIRVDTLELGWWFEHKAQQSLFRTVMKTMPTLRMLVIDLWEFGTKLPGGIANTSGQSNDDHSDPEDHTLPILECLRLTRIKIHDYQVFQKMVTSCPIRQIVIGASVTNSDIDLAEDPDRSLQPLQENANLLGWLQEKIPHVCLVDKDYCPPGFHRYVWKL